MIRIIFKLSVCLVLFLITLLPSLTLAEKEQKQKGKCTVTQKLTASKSCQLMERDNGRKTAIKKWGAIDCQTSSRVKTRRKDDPHKTAFNKKDNNNKARYLEVRNGDDFYGERCELGRNEHREGQKGTFHLYKQGRTEITFFSVYLNKNFPLRTDKWQLVMQMKQANPSDLSESGTRYGLGPVMVLEIRDGLWGLSHKERILWQRKAYKKQWTRFAFQVHYSKNKDKGFAKIYVDLNNDKDVRDKGEVSKKMYFQTLKKESKGDNADYLKKGEAIPSHLRMGIYHDSQINCTPCSMKFDNVQIVR